MPWFPREAGAYAEYVTAPSRHFEHKPHALSTEEAGALPLAGLTAWQIVVDTIHVQEGDDVLIHGGAGGVGHLAVQVAAARGANVIATARREQADFLEGLGAAQVLDYRDDDFDRRCADLDSIIDFTGALRGALARGAAAGRHDGLGAERRRPEGARAGRGSASSARPGSWSSPTRSGWPGSAT